MDEHQHVTERSAPSNALNHNRKALISNIVFKHGTYRYEKPTPIHHKIKARRRGRCPNVMICKETRAEYRIKLLLYSHLHTACQKLDKKSLSLNRQANHKPFILTHNGPPISHTRNHHSKSTG